MTATTDTIINQINTIENSMAAFQRKSTEEIKNTSKISTETKNAMDKLGEQQKEVADRMLAMEQSGINIPNAGVGVENIGSKFTSSAAYRSFSGGGAQKARMEIANNITTGSDVTVAPDRKTGVVGSSFAPLTLQSLLPTLPTASNAIEYTRENVFTNAAAETAEGGAKPESSITFELKSMPVSTVPHWVKISRQLADDAPALAAYINNRMAYAVDQRVESQLAVGDGIAPNIGGLLLAGNSTVHSYTAANLGSSLPKLVLIRKLIADCLVAGYPADAILLNPTDWANIEIELLTTAAGQMLLNYNTPGVTMLFGVPVIESVGITTDSVLVGAFQQACTLYDRQQTIVELSESDGDNFTKNLITVRAERRLALTVERPAAILSGDLTPA